MKIYVASSWRNAEQPNVVDLLRAAGHEVYDFRNPPKASGFAWSEIDPGWQSWRAVDYRAKLAHPRALEGFRSDFDAMKWADVCLLVLPCGRSAHLELGWSAGAGKRTIILTRDGEEPELMALLASDQYRGVDGRSAVDAGGAAMTRKQAEQLGPAEARKIVQLRDRDGMSFAAIGLRFGVNPKAVVYHYRKAKCSPASGEVLSC